MRYVGRMLRRSQLNSMVIGSNDELKEVRGVCGMMRIGFTL